MKLSTLKSPLQRLPNRIAQSVASDRMRGSAAMKRSARIKARDLYTCAGCGRITTALEVDHVVPLWKGGADTDGNLQCLCRECHSAKTASEAAERGHAAA